MQSDRSVSAADFSGVAIAVPGGPSLPVSAAGCVALARAVIGEARLLRGEVSGVPRDEPACWVRAAAEPAVAAWLEAVRRRGARSGSAGVRGLPDQLAEALVAGDPRTAEADLLLDVLAIVGDRRGAAVRFEEAVADCRIEAARELAYGAGHEINNPLANIAARAQSLLPGEADAERRRRLSTIVDQAFRARDMIGGLMVFARPPKPRLADIDLHEVVRPVVEAVRPLADTRGVRLEYSPPPMPLLVRVDAAQIGEALRALAMNAFEAVEDGGRVVIAAAGGAGDRCHRIEITDDGRGMDADVARRAFDPFFSGRDAGRGIGLGLPKALRLIESNGGTIDLSSRPGRGTRVLVELPAVVREQSEPATA
jgi:hypothetical protein